MGKRCTPALTYINPFSVGKWEFGKASNFQINQSKLTGSLIIEWNLENKFSPREMIPLEFWSCLGLISDTRYPIKASKRPRQHSLGLDLFRRFFSGVCSLNDRLSLKSRTHDLSDLNSDHQPLPKLFLANKFRAAIFPDYLKILKCTFICKTSNKN